MQRRETDFGFIGGFIVAQMKQVDTVKEKQAMSSHTAV